MEKGYYVFKRNGARIERDRLGEMLAKKGIAKFVKRPGRPPKTDPEPDSDEQVPVEQPEKVESTEQPEVKEVKKPTAKKPKTKAKSGK